MSLKAIMRKHQQEMNLISNKYDRKDAKRTEVLLMAMQGLSMLKDHSKKKVEEEKISTFAMDKLGLTYDKDSNLWYGSKFSSDVADELELELSSTAPSFIPLVLSDNRVRAMSEYYYASGEDYDTLTKLQTSVYDVNDLGDTFMGPKKGYSTDFNQFLTLTPDAQLNVVKPYVKDVKDDPDTKIYPGKNGDTLLKTFDSLGQDVHVNPEEAALIDLYGTDAEDWLLKRSESSDYYKENESHPVHEDTGNIQLYSSGFGKLGNIMGGIDKLSKVSGSLFGTGGSMSALGTMAGPASMLLMGADWLGGAFGAADEAKRQKKIVKDTMGSLRTLSDRSIVEGSDLMGDVKKRSKLAYESLVKGIGTGFDKIEDSVSTLTKRSKGLRTSDPEMLKNEASINLESQYDQNISKLLLDEEQNLEQIAGKTQSTLTDIGSELDSLESQMEDLESRDEWHENLF